MSEPSEPVEQQVAGPAGTLAVRDWGGTGPTLLLVHGASGTVEYFDGVAPILAAKARVVGYDLRGHGRSDAGDPAIDAHVADLFQVVEALGLRDVIPVGVSFGAWVALRAVAERGKPFRGVVNVEGPVGDRPGITEPGPIATRIRKSMTAQPYPWEGTQAELDERVRQATEAGSHGERRRYEQIGPGRYRQRPSLDDTVSIVTTGYLPFAATYDRIDLPVLVLVGRTSPAVNRTPEARQAAARSLAERHPNISLHLLDGGHDLIKEQPDELTATLANWIDALPALAQAAADQA